MCGVQHSIDDINHRFVYKDDDDRFIHMFLRSSFDVFLLCFVLFCFRLVRLKDFFVIEFESLEHWQQFWCSKVGFDYFTLMTSRNIAISLDMNWFRKTCYDICLIYQASPTALLQINCFLMWKKEMISL